MAPVRVARKAGGTVTMTLDEAREAVRREPPLRKMTDEEIEAAANTDPDAPLMSDEQLRGGRVIGLRNKVPLSMRIDPDVLEAYKAMGAGWQTRMNDVLAAGIAELPGASLDPVTSAERALQHALREVSRLRAVAPAREITQKRKRR